MSDVVNEEASGEPIPGGTADSGAMGENLDIGAIAAEFVLGTLDSEERAGANGLLESDPHFRGMVRVWERRLGELHLMVEPVDPPPPIWENIRGKLEGVEQSPSAIPPDEEPAAISADKTRSTLEALEAQLREEGLGVPPQAAEAELLAAARAADWEPGPEHQASEHQITEPAASAIRDRDLQHYPDRPPRSWGIVATLMTLIAIVLAGLIAAWRYFPDRLPPQLRAEQVLNIHPPAPPPAPVRPPAPPESQFDE